MRKWPADSVERRSTASLIPYARNARTHSREQVDQIARSIREFGFTNPVLIDEDGTIIAGHGRVLAAQKLKLREVPVMVATGWTEEEKRAYAIADNQLSLNAGWDDSILRAEVIALEDADFDTSLLGFNADDLAKLIHGDLDQPSEADAAERVSLADRFGVPPFTVLNAREGWWQDRKRAWLALGIRSELGRGEDLAGFDGAIDRREAIRHGTR